MEKRLIGFGCCLDGGSAGCKDAAVLPLLWQVDGVKIAPQEGQFWG